MLPFTREQFLDVFADWNGALGAPTVAGLWALAACAVATVALRGRHGSRLALAILALLWAVNGAGYHASFFARLTPVGYAFGLLFALEAILLGIAAARGDVALDIGSGRRGAASGVLALVALAGYSAAGHALGHVAPRAPLPGSSPCPTTILTLALLLGCPRRAPWRLAAIPIAWGIIGTSAALLLGMTEDLLLTAATLALVARQRRKVRVPSRHEPCHRIVRGASCPVDPRSSS